LLDRALTRPVRLPRPVLSVGNLTVGGTGKTPFVIMLGRKLLDGGYRVAVLTRGYAGGSHVADEPALLARSLPGAQVLVSANRARVAQEASAGACPPDVFLLDDGFQHWKLERDLDIVLLDCLAPLGFGEVIPLGLLREPLSALKRAGVAVLTRSDLVAAWKKETLREYLRMRFPQLAVVEAREEVLGFRRLKGEEAARPSRPVYAVCGIGNPVSFFRLLRREGITCAGTYALRDHHKWRQQDVVFVEAQARAAGAEVVLTTEKDATKLARLSVGMPWRVVAIRMVLGRGEEALERRLNAVLK